MASGYSLSTEFSFLFSKAFPTIIICSWSLRNIGYVFHAQNFSWEGNTTECEQPSAPPPRRPRQWFWMILDCISGIRWAHQLCRASHHVESLRSKPQDSFVNHSFIYPTNMYGISAMNLSCSSYFFVHHWTKSWAPTFYFHPYCESQNNYIVMLKKKPELESSYGNKYTFYLEKNF